MLDQKKFDEAIRHFNEVVNLNAREPESKIVKEAEKWRGISEKEKAKDLQ